MLSGICLASQERRLSHIMNTSSSNYFKNFSKINKGLQLKPRVSLRNKTRYLSLIQK